MSFIIRRPSEAAPRPASSFQEIERLKFGTTTFDRLVEEGRMPRPIAGRETSDMGRRVAFDAARPGAA
jgi:hypothetical protein